MSLYGHCIVCGSDNLEPRVRAKTGKTYYHCLDCGADMSVPMPDAAVEPSPPTDESTDASSEA